MSLYREYQASLTPSHAISLSSSSPPINSISFCVECSLLYVTDKDGHIHSRHLHRERITMEEVQQPTLLLYPASDNKGQAVYKTIIVFEVYCILFLAIFLFGQDPLIYSI